VQRPQCCHHGANSLKEGVHVSTIRCCRDQRVDLAPQPLLLPHSASGPRPRRKSRSPRHANLRTPSQHLPVQASGDSSECVPRQQSRGLGPGVSTHCQALFLLCRQVSLVALSLSSLAVCRPAPSFPFPAIPLLSLVMRFGRQLCTSNACRQILFLRPRSQGDSSGRCRRGAPSGGG
jgi:hypothetical protein